MDNLLTQIALDLDLQHNFLKRSLLPLCNQEDLLELVAREDLMEAVVAVVVGNRSPR